MEANRILIDIPLILTKGKKVLSLNDFWASYQTNQVDNSHANVSHFPLPRRNIRRHNSTFGQEQENKTLSAEFSTAFKEHIMKNASTLTTLDLKCKKVFAAKELQQVLECLPQLPKMECLDCEGFLLDNSTFTQLVNAIHEHPSIVKLCLSKKLCTESQLKELSILVSDKKTLKLVDSTGAKLGSVYTNYDVYNAEKAKAYLDGMRTTVKVALKCYKEDHRGLSPGFIVDLGAGTGQDAINLLEEGVQKLWAVDSNKGAIEILKKNIPKNKKWLIECFLEEWAPLTEHVDLFTASYTFPYRKQSIFNAFWQKVVDAIEPGGYVAGQFFGPLTKREPDPGMSYHTESQLKELLEKDFIIKYFKAGDEPKLHGGDVPPWGTLYHVVAKKIKKIAPPPIAPLVAPPIAVPMVPPFGLKDFLKQWFPF